MTKTELIKAVAASMPKLSQKDATTVVNTLFDTMTAELKKGNAIKVMNFGKFYIAKVDKTTRTIPKTKQKKEVPAHRVPRVKFSSVLKKAVW